MILLFILRYLNLVREQGPDFEIRALFLQKSFFIEDTMYQLDLSIDMTV